MEQELEFKKNVEKLNRASTINDLISGRMYRLAQASAESLIIISDKGYVVWMNDATVKLLGRSVEDMPGHFFDYLHPMDVENAEKRFIAAVTGNTTDKIECQVRVKRPDGSYVIVAHDVSKTMYLEGMTLISMREVGTPKAATTREMYGSHIETRYLNGDVQFMESNTPDWFTIPGTNRDMRCRDITSHSKKSTIWQCEVLGKIPIEEVVMDWHSHPSQKERLTVNSGEVNLEVEVNNIWTRIVCKILDIPRCHFKRTVILKEGDVFTIHEHEYHRVIGNNKGGNFMIDWHPKVMI